MLDLIKQQLAPSGVLRAGINIGNFLLVSDTDTDGQPVGVSPGIAAALAESLNLSVEYVPFDAPGAIADAVGDNTWDIANIGAEPERAKTILFSQPYCEIEATYLVPESSSIVSIDEVDQVGNRISVYARTAYGLWICDNIEKAELVKTSGMDESFNVFVEQDLEALASIRPRLVKDQQKLPGSRILDGQFSSVQQAIGIRPEHGEAAEYVQSFIEQSKANGLIADLIEKYGMNGLLSVAP
jgi:polar amino acid transport system substrate-binding protein